MVSAHTMVYRVYGVFFLMGSVFFGFCCSDSDCLRVYCVPVFLFLHPFLGYQDDSEVLQIILMKFKKTKSAP